MKLYHISIKFTNKYLHKLAKKYKQTSAQVELNT